MPSLEVVLDGFVGVKAVDVQEVDAAGVELINGLVKGRPHQPRKTRITRIVVA